MLVRAVADTRICDIGRWTDTHWAGQGAVCNLAIDRRAHVVVETVPGETVTVTEFGYQVKREATPQITIKAPDLGVVETMSPGDREYSGRAGMLKAAVNLMGINAGLRITAWSDAPPACGVGTSAAISVAMLAALARVSGQELTPYQIAELAQRLETEELKVECGVQDQHASAHGGINLMHIVYPKAQVFGVRVSDRVVAELNERLMLVYLGPRLSGQMHLRVIERFQTGNESVRAAIQRLRELPGEFATALQLGDFARAADAINDNWRQSKRLHEGITNEFIEDLHATALRAGAQAACANGAGGGGSTVILAAPGKEVDVRNAVSDLCAQALRPDGTQPGLIPFSLSTNGVRAWVIA